MMPVNDPATLLLPRVESFREPGLATTAVAEPAMTQSLRRRSRRYVRVRPRR